MLLCYCQSWHSLVYHALIQAILHKSPGMLIGWSYLLSCRYEMFTCYLGKGDKETFGYALMAMGEPYTLVRTPPRAIGTTGGAAKCSSVCGGVC